MSKGFVPQKNPLEIRSLMRDVAGEDDFVEEQSALVAGCDKDTLHEQRPGDNDITDEQSDIGLPRTLMRTRSGDDEMFDEQSGHI